MLLSILPLEAFVTDEKSSLYMVDKLTVIFALLAVQNTINTMPTEHYGTLLRDIRFQRLNDRGHIAQQVL